MARRKKKGNYTPAQRQLILEAATSPHAGTTLQQKQGWLLSQGVHRPGVPGEPVSGAAIRYWQQAHTRVELLVKQQSQATYDQHMGRILQKPPSWRQLKSMLARLNRDNLPE